jgi:hypothetical protein
MIFKRIITKNKHTFNPVHVVTCIKSSLHAKFDSDDMEYTEDAIDNMILEFSGD